ELPHSPWLVLDRRQQVGSLHLHMAVVGICILNSKICEITVATKLTSRHVIGAFPKHNHAGVLRDKDPSRRFANDTEAKHPHVEIRRLSNIVDRENVMVLKNWRHTLANEKSERWRRLCAHDSATQQRPPPFPALKCSATCSSKHKRENNWAQ